jgi:hypothetical protein
MITRNANALPVIHDCAGGEHVGSAHECESLVHGDEHVYESCPAHGIRMVMLVALVQIISVGQDEVLEKD